MIESYFNFTVLSKNKPNLKASGHENFFEQKILPKTGFTLNTKKKIRVFFITECNELIVTRREQNHDISVVKIKYPKSDQVFKRIHPKIYTE